MFVAPLFALSATFLTISEGVDPRDTHQVCVLAVHTSIGRKASPNKIHNKLFFILIIMISYK
jgi:hypothetical protein